MACPLDCVGSTAKISRRLVRTLIGLSRVDYRRRMVVKFFLWRPLLPFGLPNLPARSSSYLCDIPGLNSDSDSPYSVMPLRLGKLLAPDLRPRTL